MALQKPEWFKIDPSKFLSDSQVDAMTTEELGACFRLLCRQWIDGFIPDDIHLLGRLCRLDADAMGQAWVTLCPFFPIIEPGKRANRFMWIERDKVLSDLNKRSDEGTRAANKRWDEVRKSRHAEPNGPPMPHPMQEQSRAEQSRITPPTPSSSGKPKKPKREVRLEVFIDPSHRKAFDTLWAEWPKRGDGKPSKGSPGKAEECFKAIVEGGETSPDELVNAARLYATEYPQAVDGFIQNISTFLSLKSGLWRQFVKIARARATQPELQDA